MGQGVVRAELDQPLVDLQPVGVAALEGQVVAVGPEDVDVSFVPLEDAAEEVQLEVELRLLGQAGQGQARRRFRSLRSVRLLGCAIGSLSMGPGASRLGAGS